MFQAPLEVIVPAYLDPGAGSMIVQLVVLGTVIVGAVVLVAWLIRRSGRRPCPRCGKRVPAGQLDCQACGFDFRTVGAPAQGGR